LAHVRELFQDVAGVIDNTIVVFTAAEAISFPDGGVTPFKGRRARSGKAAIAFPALFAGRGTSSRARSITSYSPRSTGSPFEQAVGIDPKSAMSTSGALAAPVTAFQYDWNMLPIGRQLWLEHLESQVKFPPLEAPESYNLSESSTT